MPTLDNFILDKFKEVYADDLQFQRACKKADYELRNNRYVCKCRGCYCIHSIYK